MDRNFFIQLTREVYRLTLLFPKKEPLRYKIREIANNLLGDLILTQKGNPVSLQEKFSTKINPNLEILDCFLEIAKSQNWVSPKEISGLQRNYQNLANELKIKLNLEKSLSLEKQSEKLTRKAITALVKKNSYQSPSIAEKKPINERQQKILEVLENKEKVQVWEFKKIFPNVSKRTLRRDFSQMLKQGLITRLGESNSTFYKLI